MHKEKRVAGKTNLLRLIVAVLLVGAIGSAQHVEATSYDVNAKVQAPLSSQPAVITQPTSGTTVNDESLTLSGTCPIVSPQLIVILWRSTTLLGSVACNSSGYFEIPVTLISGQNIITPKLRNITNDAGVDGQLIEINYQVTTAPGTTETETTTNKNEAMAPIQAPASGNLSLELVNDTGANFVVIKPNGEVSINIEIKSGDAPYVMVVDWGDGSKTTYDFDSPGVKTIKHTYGSNHAKSIKLTITDKAGRVVTMVLGAVASGKTPERLTPSSIIAPSKPYVAIGAAATVVVIVPIVFTWQHAHLAAHTTIKSRPRVKLPRVKGVGK